MSWPPAFTTRHGPDGFLFVLLPSLGAWFSASREVMAEFYCYLGRFAFHSGVCHCLRFLVLGTGRGLRVTHSGCHLPYGRGGGSPLPGPWQHTLESSWPHRTRGRGTHRGRQRGKHQAGAEELGALWRQPGALGDFSSETDDLLLFEFGVEPLAVPH